MNARLYDKPMLPPFRCFSCSHSAADFGPYLHTGLEAVSGSVVHAVMFCASCTAQLLVPLDIVPREVYAEAVREKGLSEERAAAFGHEGAKVPELETTITRLQGELDGARSQITSLERVVKEKEHAAAQERKAALLAEVAQPKPKEEAA